jgi:hypothetical protein
MGRLAVQTFRAEPTDPELATLLDPGGRSFFPKVEDSPQRLVARPGAIPLWFVAVCLPAPVGVAAWHWTHKALRQGLQPPDAAGIALACLAVPGSVAVVWALNRHLRARGDYFILDRGQRTLALPRLHLSLRDRDIAGFVEVHAWCGGESGGHEYTWACELTVLARGRDGRLARHPVLIADDTERVSRLAETLAGFFSVGRRVLKLDRKTRARLRAEKGGV